MKTVVSYSGNGLVFAVMNIGSCWLIAVREYNVGLGSYRVIDVMSCDNEKDARSVAWAMSMPNNVKTRRFP